jgi:hypothetical protein
MVDTKRTRKPAKAAETRVGVIVLGMHRSGTSALARVLNLLGCDLPKTLVGAAPSNEAGHWESLPIARFNDRLLESAGSTWWDWMPFNPGWYSSPKVDEFREEAVALLDEEFGSSRLFVLKDPRICRLAPFWIDVLQAANIRPTAIMQLRNPLEVAESLARRDGFQPALGQLLWLRNVLEAEAATRGIARYSTSYDALLKNWPKIAEESQETLAISWPRLSMRSGGEINAFLSGQLRHHNKPPETVLDNSMLSGWLREAFAVFDRWAGNGENSENHPALDRIRTELDVATPAFSQLISGGKYSADKVKTLEASLKEIQEKLAAAETALEAKQAEVQSLEETQRQTAETQARLVQVQAELTSARAEVQTQRASLEEARGRVAHLQSELAQRQAEADDATRQLGEAQQQLTRDVEAERERHQAELDELRQRLASESEAERERLFAELAADHERKVAEFERQQREHRDRLAAELAADRERHQAELKAREEEHLGQLLQERERLGTELKEQRARTETELAKLRAEKESADRRVSERFGEIATLTRLLSDRERQVQVSDEKAARLRAISTVMLNGSASRSLKNRIKALLPAAIRVKAQMSRLKDAEIFDAEAYLDANSDVAEAGVDPLWHYLNHGIDEGRRLQRAPSSHAGGD